jgi:hypothetical protein
MVLTRDELIGSLRHEVKILLHLAGKVDRGSLDYRPTAKQRSTLELLRYLTFMGPGLLEVARTGTFDPAGWTALEKQAEPLDLGGAVAAIVSQADTYARLIGAMSEADLRAPIAPWGEPTSRGQFIVSFVLCGCAAYRTQLFLYLKSCGREELGTSNLWDGEDPPAKT